MKKQWWLGALALAAVGCGGGGGGGNNGGGGDNDIASVGVAAFTDDNEIILFNTNNPGTINETYTVTGLPNGDPVVSMDYRPAEPTFFYLVTQSGALYRVSTFSIGNIVVATSVGTIDTGGETVREIDFNPVADRLRVAATDGVSLRVDATNAATTTDTAFNYITGNAVQIEGVAYTNSFQTATTTTLYGIDVQRDALVVVNPPNAGTLTDVGSLGINLSGRVPFDISPADDELGFIVQQEGGRSRIVQVDITDGSTVRGRLTPDGVQVVGIVVLPLT